MINKFFIVFTLNYHTVNQGVKNHYPTLHLSITFFLKLVLMKVQQQKQSRINRNFARNNKHFSNGLRGGSFIKC